jgi:signal transduction histidine kinase
MDIQTIDQQYQQLQAEAQQVGQQLQTLAGKLQAAAQGGNTDAREWLLDLREVALGIQAEQQQMTQVLQAIHAMWQNQAQQLQAMPAAMPGYLPAGMAQNAAAVQQGGLMGALDGFLNSGFGRAIEMGAGFGLGDDLINKLF